MGAADRARARLVDGLRDSGRLCSAAVEEAFRAVPRHLFLPGVPLPRAYADEAVAVQAVDGVTTSSASQPSMMAIMLAQLDLRPGHRVLEVGAGTGYNAALMTRLVGQEGRVVAIDIDADLVEGAARHLTVVSPGGEEYAGCYLDILVDGIDRPGAHRSAVLGADLAVVEMREERRRVERRGVHLAHGAVANTPMQAAVINRRR